MADSNSLWIHGFILGAVTAIVMLIAGVVVHAHVDGRLHLDGERVATSASALTR